MAGAYREALAARSRWTRSSPKRRPACRPPPDNRPNPRPSALGLLDRTSRYRDPGNGYLAQPPNNSTTWRECRRADSAVQPAADRSPRQVWSPRYQRFAQELCLFVQASLACASSPGAAWTKPRPRSLAAGLATDLVRRRHDLVLENAFLRQVVIVLSRAARRPMSTRWDRGLLILLASRPRTSASAPMIVRHEPLLRWHRQGFQHF